MYNAMVFKTLNIRQQWTVIPERQETKLALQYFQLEKTMKGKKKSSRCLVRTQS